MSAQREQPDPDEQQERHLEAAAAQAGWQENNGFQKDVLRYLAETDLNNDSKREFRSLFTRDWVFGNIDDAGYTELVWELRHLKHMFYDAHPGPDSLITGEDRAAINDDPSDTLRALPPDEKREVEQLFRDIRLRLTRSKGMQQQRIIQTNISQTEVARSSTNNNGILDRLKR